MCQNACSTILQCRHRQTMPDQQAALVFWITKEMIECVGACQIGRQACAELADSS